MSYQSPATTPQQEALSQDDIRAPQPAYSTNYGEMDIGQEGFGTRAFVADDGRVDVNIQERGRRLSTALQEVFTPTETISPGAPILQSLEDTYGKSSIPRLNLVIQLVGSRGDIQPFIALGKVLKEEYRHRVRIATHLIFKGAVEENGLEFFNIGGDPTQLMSFMVKNPGLMPGYEAFRNGDIGKRRREISEILHGCWLSCFEAEDGSGRNTSESLPGGTQGYKTETELNPFIADAIIANPPSFAHIHCAEKLGIPLHLMFTMPWSPTQKFPHPLVNIQSSNVEIGAANFISYALTEMLTWQGLGDVINRFRERDLGLRPISLISGPGMISRLRVPYTYCWSSSLLPKPRDWGSHIDVAGFYFLSSPSDYTSPAQLANFLDAGPTPIYIGFGSIVIDNPDELTKLVLEAVRKSGQRALISKGWGSIGESELELPEQVLMVENCPHDWLFKQVSCVVHHGGAGTTAAGLGCGKPTVVIPFFGDQPFWGSIVAEAGAGPPPIPYKRLTAESLAAAIVSALEPETVLNAERLGRHIQGESGVKLGATSFHNHLDPASLRCMLIHNLPAVWCIRNTNIRLSALAVAALENEGILGLDDLKLYRPREYSINLGPYDPISGGATALIGSIADFTIGIADFPGELIQATFPPRSNTMEDTPVRSSRAASPMPSTSSDTGDKRLRRASSPEAPSSPPQKADENSRQEADENKRCDVDKWKATMDNVITTGYAVTNLVDIGLRSPMHFALGIAKGFHDAPKLYGDQSVREWEEVTDFQSGLRAAGKEFGYGFYDGISGLVTQPIEGLKDGAAGGIMGIIKGVGGLILKPGAGMVNLVNSPLYGSPLLTEINTGIFGLAGHTLSGIHQEIQKRCGTTVDSYIIACRSKQGYDEWSQATQRERDDIIQKWQSLGVDLQIREEEIPTQNGMDGPTEFAIWRTLTDRMRLSNQGEPKGIEHRG
ncbi:uncharacterized protein GIQ15_03903 [Arthroderma uncinatum]|uniref:uncharacterized protein n=1 Tax=Arthroderma uncinatum TaxID=74035 RepID=UPI00144AF33C|nr:uncharacterized protein GIQ15_03903 [Arthroderma uncinatum]KAF3481144.1 hypothetical protein GIQ15_03903 [Arthroderma uncinatum]